MTTPRFRLWPTIGVMAVATIWIISATANWWAGTLLAKEPYMSHILGAASVACDILKAVALFVVMGAIANKRWVVMSVALVLFGLCTAWSLRSAAYFAADAISEKVATVETSNAIQMARLQIIDAKTRRAQFLAEQRVTVAGTRATRQDAIQANRQSSAEFNELTNDLEGDIKVLEQSKQVLKASTDPLADLLSVDKQITMLATAFFFALLMELASSTGFWLIARAAARPSLPTPPKIVEAIPEPAEKSSTFGIALESGPVEKPADVQAERLEAQPVASNVVLVDFADRDAKKLREAILDTLEEGKPEDRILIATVAQEVSRRLPKAKAVTGRGAIISTLWPAMKQTIPLADKRRAAGNTWVYGVRLRQGNESANA
jgi:hypothetical protein